MKRGNQFRSNNALQACRRYIDKAVKTFSTGNEPSLLIDPTDKKIKTLETRVQPRMIPSIGQSIVTMGFIFTECSKFEIYLSILTSDIGPRMPYDAYTVKLVKLFQLHIP